MASSQLPRTMQQQSLNGIHSRQAVDNLDSIAVKYGQTRTTNSTQKMSAAHVGKICLQLERDCFLGSKKWRSSRERQSLNRWSPTAEGNIQWNKYKSSPFSAQGGSVDQIKCFLGLGRKWYWKWMGLSSRFGWISWFRVVLWAASACSQVAWQQAKPVAGWER